MSSESLPTGYQLHNYRIEQVLGEGGFGITYKAVDLNLNRVVAIKEFMPRAYAARSDTGDVEPRNADCEVLYQKGLMSFVKEAQALALFEHVNIVKVNAFLRHHNTAYIIMEYVDGMTFSEWLRQNPMPSQSDLLSILSPILSGLHELHKVDLLHRDIKPSNIYICHNDRPLLLDFGAVRYSMFSDHSEEPSVVMLTEGFSPPEQYGKSGQGPWTDVYAVGACLHLAVTGRKVINAMERYTESLNGGSDPQPNLADTALRKDFSDYFLGAITQAISLNSKDRIQGALQLNNRLLGAESENTSADTLDPLASGYVSIDAASEISAHQEGTVALPEPLAVEDIATVARYPGAGNDGATQFAGSAIEQPEQSVAQREPGVTGSRTGKKKIVAASAGFAVLIALIWFVQSQMRREQVPESVINGIKSQIDRKVELAEFMGLPISGKFEEAMASQQLGLDIESKKIDGSVIEIRDNLVSADMLLEAHIHETAPLRQAALLDAVNLVSDKAEQLGVVGSEVPELSKFSTQASEIESIGADFSELKDIESKLLKAVINNNRSYEIGSSKQDIEDALELCRQYSASCVPEWYEDELSRSVTLEPFELDRSEVTVDEFRLYAEQFEVVTTAETEGFSYSVDPDKGFAVFRTIGVSWKNAYGGNGRNANLPVVHVSRRDAQQYCESLGKRLPTEAEWEYTARGVERFKYPWGNVWDPSRLNWAGSATQGLLPVDSFEATDRGYFDLAGSVTEWTSSDSEKENAALLKGGSRFDSNVANFRLSVRRLESSDYTGEDVGFRCATSLPAWPESS
ncbi:MAG: SUMF1/EgtB/PvdO family nonheme iron enzyme [Granulosicoccus sp.]